MAVQYGARLLGAMVDELEQVQADSSQSAQMGPTLPSLLEEARRQLSAVQARTLGQPAGQVGTLAAGLRLGGQVSSVRRGRSWGALGQLGCLAVRLQWLSCGVAAELGWRGLLRCPAQLAAVMSAWSMRLTAPVLQRHLGIFNAPVWASMGGAASRLIVHMCNAWNCMHEASGSDS